MVYNGYLIDLTSGDNNATNSKLLVGPVNMSHNQSSYQCIFTIASFKWLEIFDKRCRNNDSSR